MNILLITWNYPPKVGGMENMISQLVNQWQKSVTVTVIGPAGSEGTHFDDVVRPKINGILWFLGSAFYHSIRLLRTGAFDVIVTGSALVAPLAVILGFFFRCPVASLIHGLDLLYSQPIYQLAIKYFLPRCNFLFANSQHTKELAIARGAIPNRIEVINPGLDFKEFSCIKKTEFFLKQVSLKNRRVILSAGRLVTRKGIPEFVEHVVSRLVTLQPDLLFLVVGENPIQSLTHKEDIKTRIIETVKKCNLSDNVLLLGHVDRHELIQLYSIADIFVLPAITIPNDVEGFGIVLLEAGAAGCPAVSTRLGGIPDAVADGQSGLLVEPDDWHAMTAAIIRLLHDHSFRKNLGINSRERVKDFFDWPIIGERYLSLLRNLKAHNQIEII